MERANESKKSFLAIRGLINRSDVSRLRRTSSAIWARLANTIAFLITIWHRAINHENPKILDIVMRKVNFGTPKPFHIDLLCECIRADRSDLVERIININPYSATACDPSYPRCAILTAVSLGDIEMIKILLAHGASPNAADDWESALGHAISRGNVDLTMVLLKGGADPNLPNERSCPRFFGASSTEMLNILIEFGADLNRRGPYLDSFLHEKAQEKDFYLLQFGLETCSRLHLDLSANTADSHGDTPLHIAATTGFISMARLLLQHGANIDARNNRGRTPLMEAVDWCQPAMGRFLLEQGANPQASDFQGRSTLDQALASEYPGIRDLVAYLIIFKIRDDYGVYAPHLATTLSSSFGSWGSWGPETGYYDCYFEGPRSGGYIHGHVWNFEYS